MQADGWQASDWLGVLIAGALYTPMHDQATMAQNLPNLLQQIQAAAPTRVVPTTAEASASSRSAVQNSPKAVEKQALAALRQELQTSRLMGLHKRALSDGIEASVVDDAMDTPDPKATLITLLMDQARKSAPTKTEAAAPNSDEVMSLRSELESLRRSLARQAVKRAGARDGDGEDINLHKLPMSPINLSENLLRSDAYPYRE